MTARLATELALLYRAEALRKIPAAPIVRQLIADDERPLPDALPPKPAWVEFEWPESGTVDWNPYWCSVDRERGSARFDKWSGPYL